MSAAETFCFDSLKLRKRLIKFKKQHFLMETFQTPLEKTLPYWMQFHEIFFLFHTKWSILNKKNETLLSSFKEIKAPVWNKLLLTGLKKTPCIYLPDLIQIFTNPLSIWFVIKRPSILSYSWFFQIFFYKPCMKIVKRILSVTTAIKHLNMTK